jgi:hypothetical protein
VNGFVVEGRKGRWTIRPLTMYGKPLTDDEGNVRTWVTKGEAEKVRRDLERGMTGIPRERSDFFRTGVARFR